MERGRLRELIEEDQAGVREETEVENGEEETGPG